MTARRILELAGELKLHIGNAHVVINRVQPGREEEAARLAAQRSIEVTGVIHDDPSLFAMDAEGKSVFSLNGSAALLDAYGIFDKNLKR
jgi:CO dehydrogenase nickel-insertion accessory protein CooC1